MDQIESKRAPRLFTIKDIKGGDLIFDLEHIHMLILPSFLALTPEQRNANVAAVLLTSLKLDLTYDQVSKIRRAWMDYYGIETPQAEVIPSKFMQ